MPNPQCTPPSPLPHSNSAAQNVENALKRKYRFQRKRGRKKKEDGRRRREKAGKRKKEEKESKKERKKKGRRGMGVWGEGEERGERNKAREKVLARWCGPPTARIMDNLNVTYQIQPVRTCDSNEPCLTPLVLP